MIRKAVLTFAAVLTLLVALSAPDVLSAQVTGGADPFRPYLHVFLAYGAAWLIIGAWIFQIGRKVTQLGRRLDGDVTNSAVE